MFTGLKQNHKVIRKKDICPKFLDGADLRCQAQHQAERYLLGSNEHIEQATTKWTTMDESVTFIHHSGHHIYVRTCRDLCASASAFSQRLQLRLVRRAV